MFLTFGPWRVEAVSKTRYRLQKLPWQGGGVLPVTLLQTCQKLCSSCVFSCVRILLVGSVEISFANHIVLNSLERPFVCLFLEWNMFLELLDWSNALI